MSGNTIGTIIGGTVGFVIAGPGGISLGMSIGGIAGGLLLPNQLGIQDQAGPRLRDLKVTTSTYGVPINRVFGSYRVNGNILWADSIQETQHVEEVEVGKGGSETYDVITYTYSINMAIGFCEGEVTGIRKIWADSKLIFDMDSEVNNHTYQASYVSSEAFDIYLGSETQEPNWMLQSYNPDSSAYRGLCYVVFKGFQLENFGNRIPNITAEVVRNGDLIQKSGTEIDIDHLQIMTDVSGWGYTQELTSHCSVYDSPYYYSFMYPHTQGGTVDVGKAMIFKWSTDGGLIDYKLFTFGFSGNTHTALVSGDKPVFAIAAGRHVRHISFNEDLSIDNNIYTYIEPAQDSDWFSIETSTLYNGNFYTTPYAITDGYEYIYDINNQRIIAKDVYDIKSLSWLVANDDFIIVQSDHDLSGLYILRIYDTDGVIVIDIDFSAEPYKFEFFNDNSNQAGIYDNIYYNVNSDHNTSKTYIMTVDLGTFVYGIQLIQNSGYGGAYGDTGGTYYAGMYFPYANRSFGRIYPQPVLSLAEVSVSSICQELFEASNMTDYDLSQTDDKHVSGLLVDQITSARAVVEKLQVAYLFDLIENDGLIKSISRGKDSILTLNSSQMLQNEIQTKEIETNMPQSVSITYSNKNKNYLIGSQIVERIDSISDNHLTIELPMTFDDTEAKAIAEIMLFSSYSEKDKFNFKLPNEFMYLQVGNVITLNIEDFNADVRITKIIYGYDIEINAVRESNYESSAIGSDSGEGSEDDDLYLQRPSILKVFNAPTLDNNFINSFGLYFSATGENDNWKGCVVLKSKDLGATYDKIGEVLYGDAVGSTTSVLSDGATTVIDFNSVTIYVFSGTLSSITIEQLFNGFNYVKIGDEILQYKNATYIGDNAYTLDTLLRGRRGTEWATNSHSTGESFIFLNKNTIGYSFSTLNDERFYKAVTTGLDLNSAGVVKQTYDGTNLIPFSVINRTGPYEENGDIIIEWMRRDRYISGYLRALPMSEQSELYQLNVYNFNTQNLLRTVELSNDSYNYTGSDRQDDGLRGNNSDQFFYEIIQISQAIGDGYYDRYLKTSEYKPSRHYDDFVGTDGSLPSQDWYENYQYGTIDAATREIRDNSLYLYVDPGSYNSYAGFGLRSTIRAVSDFSILINVTPLPYYYTDSGVMIHCGSSYIGTDFTSSSGTTAKMNIIYHDIDNGTVKSIGSGAAGCKKLKIEGIDGIITYSYMRANDNVWREAPDKVTTYDYSNQLFRMYARAKDNYNQTVTYSVHDLEIYA